MKRTRNSFFCAAVLLVNMAAALAAQNGSPKTPQATKSKTTMSDNTPTDNALLYGDPNRRPSKAHKLTAGPVRVTFQDGELRYLYVGDKEIVRRIYFAVRNKSWATAMPEFSHVNIQQKNDSFTIDLKATCKSVGADFAWTGKIVGTPEGKITFQASGAAGEAFESNRIGLCVLYGTPTLVGQKFETVDETGSVKPNVFPEFVNPQLVAPRYQTLRYTTPDGLTVTTTAVGATFDMEDQRTYSDSSFKAYAPLPYDYKSPIPQGKTLEETVTVEVSGAKAAAARPNSTGQVITVNVGGSAIPGAKVPKIGVSDPSAKSGIFGSVNNNAASHNGAKELTWGYNPAVHLPDDDTFFENIPNITEQVKTAHSYAPGAAITLDPVSLGSTRPGADRDARNDGLLASAWSAAFLKYAALAGVSEVRFQGEARYGKAVQDDIAALAGQPLLSTQRGSNNKGEAAYPFPVEAFAVQSPSGKVVLYLINQSAVPQTVEYKGLPAQSIGLRRFGAKVTSETLSSQMLTVTLAPYEVCRIEGQ